MFSDGQHSSHSVGLAQGQTTFFLGLPPFSPLDPTNNIVPNREEINISVANLALLPGTFFFPVKEKLH